MSATVTPIKHTRMGKVGEITPVTEDGLTLFWVEFSHGPFFDIHVDFDKAVEAAQTVVRDFLKDENWQDCVK